MAIYTAFFGSPRPGPPYWDGEKNVAVIYADVCVVDSSSQIVPPWGMTDSGFSYCTIQSNEPFTANDTLNTIRQKVMAAFRINWQPTIQPSDLVKVVWLDSGGLLNL